MTKNNNDVDTNKPEIGTLWWHFDSRAEADAWVAENEGRGVSNIRMQDRPDSTVVGVVFDIEKSRVQDILGYEPEDEEWLTEEDAPNS